jgi:omega-6 fatty acid desaturase (delta-12 desaturase)
MIGTKEEGIMSAKTDAARPNWLKTTKLYEQIDLRKSIWQLVNTIVPYLVLWYLMIRTIQLGYSYWLTLALAVLAAGFLVRIFIFFHDCGHGTFFASPQARTILGYITGILTFTPYHAWAHNHRIHHATAGDLDRRSVGDVWTMTVEEYRAAPRSRQIFYRLFRNPIFMLSVGPIIVFLISARFPPKGAKKRERQSVLITNLAVLAILVIAWLTIGLRVYLMIQLPVILVAAAAGIWLFYVQHQFEGVYWARHEEWDLIRASLEGSSYYKLPKVLQWFTGNIGLHHIHHIRPRIPNYNLQRCYDETPAFQAVTPITLRTSLRSLWLNLYDEVSGKLVSFRALKTIAQAR